MKTTRKKTAGGGGAFIKGIKALRKLFAEEYRDGGWLSPGREMSGKIGISYMTYCKALNRMVEEGFAQSFPKKGHWVVPKRLRCRKIGLIINSANTNPFFLECDCMAKIFNILYESRFTAQLIQGNSQSQLIEGALANGVEGLLWLNPSIKESELIRKIDDNKDIPIVVVQGQYLGSNVMLSRGCVAHDANQILQERVKIILTRGHRHVLYIGNDHQFALEHGMVQLFRDKGGDLPPHLCLKNYQFEPNEFLSLLQENQITGILCEGNITCVDQLFSNLSALSNDCCPEVLVSRFSHLDELLNKYPAVKHVPCYEEAVSNLAETGIKMLLEHILEGKKLSQIKIPNQLTMQNPARGGTS